MVELLTLSAIQCKAPQCVHMVVIGPHVKVVTGTGSWYCCLAISIRCLPDEQFSHGNIAGQGLGGKGQFDSMARRRATHRTHIPLVDAQHVVSDVVPLFLPPRPY
jgi:hypothetical protein